MFDDGFVVLVERDGDGVETHPRNTFVLQEPSPPQRFACDAQTSLLARRDAVERALIRTRSTRAHFDDDDDVTFLHEQIDLGAADVQVSREDRISYVFKVVCRGVFGTRAGQVTCACCVG